MRSGNPGDNVGRDHKLYLLPSLCGVFGDLSMLNVSSLGEARSRNYRPARTISVLAAMIMDNAGSPVVSLNLRKCNPPWRIEEFSRPHTYIRRSTFTPEEEGSICLPSTRSIKSADS